MIEGEALPAVRTGPLQEICRRSIEHMEIPLVATPADGDKCHQAESHQQRESLQQLDVRSLHQIRRAAKCWPEEDVMSRIIAEKAAAGKHRSRPGRRAGRKLVTA